MRKLLLIGLAWLVMVAWVAPALADVNVYADITKDKDITVDETITILKFVTLTATVTTTGDQAAESDAIANQTNADNYACENCAEKQNYIIGSVLSNTGITNVNQAVGNMNNQGNINAVALDNPPGQSGGEPERSGIANAQASVDQKQGQKVVGYVVETGTVEIIGQVLEDSPNVVNSTHILFRDSIITGSINHNVGVTNVNQAAGQMNNQANATALAVCLDGAIALSETDLGQYSLGNQVYETFTTKTASILGSINENRGVTFVNQTSGNMANQGNALSLSYSRAVPQ